MWRDRRILDLFGIEHPVIQAPMAGPVLSDMVIAVANEGGLGSLPSAMLSHEQARAEMAKVRAGTKAPINMNFFCHTPPAYDEQREMAWREKLKPYYVELGVDPAAPSPPAPATSRRCGRVRRCASAARCRLPNSRACSSKRRRRCWALWRAGRRKNKTGATFAAPVQISQA